MRTYTTRPIDDSQAMKSDDINIESTDALRVVNGGIDQNQVPLEAIDTPHLSEPALPGPADVYLGTRSSFMATSSYHRSIRQVAEDAPSITIATATDENVGGWRSLWPLQPLQDPGGTVMEFVGRDGMLRGGCQIDIERRITYVDRADPPTDPATHPATHLTDWMRIGVFVNGALIADTGHMYPRRQTIDLHWACPAPAGYCRVEVKFIQNTTTESTGLVDGVLYAYVAPGVQYPAIKIYSTYLWCRNKYR